MGYACPVCEEPQIDARHLANHLAFLAMLGREEHEAWLAEHAPEWSDAGEQELAARVEELASSAEYPQVFEDTTGRIDSEHLDDTERSGKLFEDGEAWNASGGTSGEGTDPRDEVLPGQEGHEHGHQHGHGHQQNQQGQHDHQHGQPGGSHVTEGANLTPEQQEIMQEAQELTREMLEEEEANEGEADDGKADEGDADEGAADETEE